MHLQLLRPDRGKSVIILAPPASIPRGRTAALLDGSVRFLKSLGVWDPERFEAAPLRGIRLIDDTASIIRAPEVTFRASEIDLETFGYNIPNSLIVETLARVAKMTPDIEIVPEAATDISFQDDQASIGTEGGKRIAADLVVAADGARSLVRKAAAIGERSWEYPQSALITTLSVEQDHSGISTEFHTRTGPFTACSAWAEQDEPCVDARSGTGRGTVKHARGGV